VEQSYTHQNLKVLIVDDSALIITRLRQMLSDIAKVDIIGAVRNIGSAISVINEQVPDVAILDIYLEADAPTANGINLLSFLSKNFPTVQVIMLTNLAGPLYRNNCMTLGAKYFLDKSNEFEMIPDILLRIANEKQVSGK
jgi:DNA-binding NarL/FixJ family response regulator